MRQQFINSRIISEAGQVIAQNANTIIFDDSFQTIEEVATSLKAFAEEAMPTKVLLLADINEDAATHEALGKIVAEYAPELVIFHGKAVQHALASNPKAYYFPDKFSLHNWLSDRKFQNTYLLILGGKALNIETVLQFV